MHLRSYSATGQRLCWTQRPRRRPDLQDRKSEGPSLSVAGPTPKLPRLYLQEPRSVPGAEGNVFFEVQAPKLLTAAIADIIKHKQTFSKREHISSSTQYEWPVPTWRQTARSNPTPSQARRDLAGHPRGVKLGFGDNKTRLLTTVRLKTPALQWRGPHPCSEQGRTHTSCGPR